MATYSVPGQQLSFAIPDEGEVFKTSVGGGADTIFVRSGGKLYSTSAQSLGVSLAQKQGIDVRNAIGVPYQQMGYDHLKSLGIDINAIPTKGYNAADFRTAFGDIQSLSDFGLLKGSTDPAHAGEVITQGVSATNPNAPTFTSSTRGDITPAGIPKYGAPGAIIPPANIGDYRNPNPQPGSAQDIALNQINEQNQQAIFRAPGGFLAPKPTQIGNPVTPPSTGGAAPTFPQSQGGTAADIFHTSLTSSLDTLRGQLDQTYNSRISEYDTKIKAIESEQKDLQSSMDMGMSTMGSVTLGAAKDKAAALETEKKQFQEQYDAKQALIGEMDGLLTAGNQIVETMRKTTGLSSIMSPRIAQTMSDVVARAGIIKTLLDARDGQIGVAQSQLRTTVDTITSIAHDQIDWYKSLVNFYDSQKKDNAAKITTLSREEKTYIDAKINQMEGMVKNAQDTANLISKAMLDPDTALAYNKAGISLTDTPPQIAQKLATYKEAQGLQWGPAILKGGDYVQQNKVTGQYRTVVSNVSSGTGTGGRTTTTTTTTPGKFTSAQLNRGAAQAGVSTADFGGLQPDVQNFYINATSANLTDIQKAIAAVRTGQATAVDATSAVDALNVAPAVKEHIKGLIQQAAPPAPANSGGAIGNLWGGIKNFLGF